MGLLDAFEKKKSELTDEQKKWNKIWELWSAGSAESPYAERMTYQIEIYDGGHVQYFTDVENTGELQKEMSALETILSAKLKQNLQRAYHAYLVLEEKARDADAEKTMEECDNAFYENEEEHNHTLEKYAAEIEL